MSLTSKINNTLSVLVILADAEWAVIEVQNIGGKISFLTFLESMHSLAKHDMTVEVKSDNRNIPCLSGQTYVLIGVLFCCNSVRTLTL